MNLKIINRYSKELFFITTCYWIYLSKLRPSESNRIVLNNTQPYACLSSYWVRHGMLGGCYSVHCGVRYAKLTVGYLKLARNPNFRSQVDAKISSYLEKFVSWDTHKSRYNCISFYFGFIYLGSYIFTLQSVHRQSWTSPHVTGLHGVNHVFQAGANHDK